MGNWYCRRFGKFYAKQVNYILALIKRSYKDTGIDLEKYLAVCEQLNEEPDPDKMPVDRSIFPLEVQEAFMLHDFLSERWDGMNGYYLGKDYSALETYLNVLDIEDSKQSLYFLKHIEYYNSEKINASIKAKRDAEERRAKMKR